MTTPTLLMTFEGTLTGQAQSGPVTATGFGTTAYADGLVPGTQAYVAQQSTGSYLTIAGAYLNASAGEVVMRVRPSTTYDSTSQYFFANTGFASNNRLYLRRMADGNVLRGSFGVLDNLDAWQNPMTSDTYHTISLRWSGTSVAMYLDNPTTPVAAITATAITGPGNGITLGRSGASTSQYANGRLDDLAIYGDALTDEQRAVLFDTGTVWTWNLLNPASAPRPSRVFVLGSPHNIGPLRVGRR